LILTMDFTNVGDLDNRVFFCSWEDTYLHD